MARNTSTNSSSWRHRLPARALGAIRPKTGVVVIAALVVVGMNLPFADSVSGVVPVAGTITGRVFNDYNSNGVRDTAGTADNPAVDIGVAGTTVEAVDAAGTVVGTATTAADGTYSLAVVDAASTAIRVQFTPPDGYESAYAGPDSGTSVQFVTLGSTDTEVDFGVLVPEDYCQSDPDLVLPCFIGVDPALVARGSMAPSMKTYHWSDLDWGATIGTHGTKVADVVDTGTVYGVAYQKSSGQVFSAATLRRHAGLGPLGIGGIYITDAAAGTTTSFVDVATLGIDVGTVPSNAARGIQASAGAPSADLAAYPLIGRVGFGDLEMSTDGTALYATNLNDGRLYRIQVGEPPAVPTAADVSSVGVTVPGCANGVARPDGVSVHRGRVYVGVTCTAELAGGASDMVAYVVSAPEADVEAGSPSWATEVTVPLDYSRGCALSPDGNCSGDAYSWTRWYPWTDTYDSAWEVPTFLNLFPPLVSHAQPLLSDIDFDADGSMILGLRDRFGDQVGSNNYRPIAGSTQLVQGVASGDILRACSSGANFVLESNGTCGATTTVGAGSNQGPDGGEYYWQDFTMGGGHSEATLGATATLPGATEVASTVMDPFALNSGGYTFFEPQGGQTRSVEAYNLSTPGAFAKANGLGDLAVLCDEAPIQIGNRVWYDLDVDGVQDADEHPIPGVVVTLYDALGAVVSTATTDADGLYYFSDLEKNTDYSLAFDPSAADLTGIPSAPNDPAELILSAAGAGSNRSVDSNPAPDGTFSYTTGGPGQNDHTIDAGYSALFDLALRKTLAAGQPSIVAPGDTVDFTVTVFNQGVIEGANITLIDYLPPGTTLADPDWTDNGDGTASIALAGVILQPGETTTVDITVLIPADATAVSFTNTAEITSATDGDGDHQTDIDSVPDADNDDVLIDDEILLTPDTGDEDDHDIALVTVEPVATTTTSTTEATTTSSTTTSTTEPTTTTSTTEPTTTSSTTTSTTEPTTTSSTTTSTTEPTTTSSTTTSTTEPTTTSSTSSSTTSTTEPSSTSSTTTSTTEAPQVLDSTTVPGGNGTTPPNVSDGTIVRTGSNTHLPVVVGTCLVAVGVLILGLRRRATSRP